MILQLAGGAEASDDVSEWGGEGAVAEYGDDHALGMKMLEQGEGSSGLGRAGGEMVSSPPWRGGNGRS